MLDGVCEEETLNIPVQELSRTDDLWVLVVVGSCCIVVAAAAAAGIHHHTLVVLCNYIEVAAGAVVVVDMRSLRILRLHKEEVHWRSQSCSAFVDFELVQARLQPRVPRMQPRFCGALPDVVDVLV